MRLTIGLASLLLAVSLPGWGDSTLYRWKDESGQVHFGQTPPASGHYDVMRGARPAAVTPSTTPAPPAAPSAAATAAAEQRARDLKFLEQAEAARKAKSEALEKEKVAKADKDLRCKTAQQNMFALQERHAYVGMNVDEFTRQMEDAKKDVAAYCS